MNLLLLCSSDPSSHLIKAITAKGHTFEVYKPQDLYLTISDGESGFDRIYHGNKTFAEPIRLKAKNYDAVVSRIGDSLSHSATILRHLTENLGIYSTQDPDGLETASNKLKTTQKLSYASIPVPLTAYASDPVHIDFLINKVGGLPAIGKLLQGSQGKGVFILETPVAANTVLESFSKLSASVKLQQFIEAGGRDIRAIVVGNKVAVAMERQGKRDFRANVSLGGSGKLITLSKDDESICVRASQKLGLDFSGVDIMKDKRGTTYVIEVNGNPGTKIINITGHNYFVDLIKMIERKLTSGDVNRNRSVENNNSSGIELIQVDKTCTLLQDELPNKEILTQTDHQARESWKRFRLASK